MKKTTRMLIALAFFVCPSLLNAQGTAISGIVQNNSNKEPLYGISVRVKGTGNGVTTDKDGSFRLNVPSLPVTLEVSYAEF
ncbi:MAG: carboxypeptidase-like regulatory domain-containing protein, partial [Chitinophagales bacterium]